MRNQKVMWKLLISFLAFSLFVVTTISPLANTVSQEEKNETTEEVTEKPQETDGSMEAVTEEGQETEVPLPEESVEPTVVPTVEPTVEPTIEPTVDPTIEPTVVPTVEPTEQPEEEVSEEEKVDTKSTEDRFNELIEKMYAEIPEGQEKVGYTNNYESMEPEAYSILRGEVTSTIESGKNILSSKMMTMAELEKSPYFSSGYYKIKFKHDAKVKDGDQYQQLGLGFLMKSHELYIRMDAEKSGGVEGNKDWVLQKNGGWLNINGQDKPKLLPDVENVMEIYFHKDQLTLALNGEIFYDNTTSVLGSTSDIVGKFGINTRFLPANFTIDELQIEGVGYNEKPKPPATTYFKDYEDGNPGNWDTPEMANVVDDGSGTNNILKLKAVGDSRYVDLDSPHLDKGGLSLDFKVASPGSGYAINFRSIFDGSKVTKLSSLSFAPHEKDWIWESGSKWSGTLGIGEVKLSVWNNLILNFDDDRITVYLNKEKMGDYTYEEFKGAEAGLFGVRLRRGAEFYIDNLVYTSEEIIPEEIKEYNNNFDENFSGVWSNADYKILDAGENKILEINTGSKLSLLETNIELAAGTALARVKPLNDDVKFVVGATVDKQVSISYNKTSGNWVLSIDGEDFNFDSSLTNFKKYKWNTFGLSFAGSSATLDINGIQSTVDLGSKVISSGTFGISSSELMYLDDVTYSEKELPYLIPETTADKLYYVDYFDTQGTQEWINLEDFKLVDGKITGNLGANGTAFDQNVSPMTNGVYQIQLDATNELGVQYGNIKVYPRGDEWFANISNKEVKIGDYAVDTDSVIIRVQQLKKEGTLWVNNILVGTYDATRLIPGRFGVYNPNAKAVSVAIDAVGAEEIRIFERDYETDEAMLWERIEGTGSIEAKIVDGKLVGSLIPVVTAVDKSTPNFLDQKVSFDFSVSVDDGVTTGGRYGFVIRGSEKEYTSIVCDINGIWTVRTGGNTYFLPVMYSLDKDTMYHMDASIIGDVVSFAITDGTGKKTEIGNVNIDSANLPGHFGLRAWYSGKDITTDNLVMEEVPTLPQFMLKTETTTLVDGDFEVEIDTAIPRVMEYRLNGKVITTESLNNTSMIINGRAYTPAVTGVQDGKKYTYNMKFAEIDVEMTAEFKLEANNVLTFNITEIKENSDFLVNNVELGSSSLAHVRSDDTDAGYAWAKSNGQWHGLSEQIVEDLATIEKNSDGSATMVMLAKDGLALSIENNVMSGGNKINISQKKKTFINTVTLSNGSWTYRHVENDKDTVEDLPTFKVVVTEDLNDDSVVDWQDGAIAYREHILVKPFEAEDMANNMMYIPFNFASQANDPFLNSLDQAKVLYNYSDGFGQMLLHKGYQDEGHDSNIPSYSSVGVRQGGTEDLKFLLDEGDKYNVKVGVHLNATEYHLDANELYYANLTGATDKGPVNIPTGTVYESGYDRLAPGWGWLDNAFYVNQTKDLITGQLEKRFTDLVNTTTTDAGNMLDFFYVDVYTGNDYNAYKLLDIANGLGVKVGTEFAGPLEPGANFVHWGPDLGYPNKGNGSLVYRMVKNDQDIFVGNALFKGQKIAVVSTWGNSKPDIEQGIFVFFNEVLPTKYMQHYGVMKVATDEINFEKDLTSKRNKNTGKIELTKEGKLISSWEDTGTTTLESERHTAEAESLIPWEWDNDNNVLGLDNGAKLYHWNTSGSATTWELTEKFAKAKAYDLYELTQQGRVKVSTINVVNGKLTIDAKRNTPYVLYPSGVNAEEFLPAATSWGEGSEVLDFAFNSEKLGDDADWKVEENTNATIEIVAPLKEYSTKKEMTYSRLDRYAQIDNAGGALYQDISVKPNTGYELEVWTRTTNGKKSTLEVSVGDKTYSNYVTGQDGDHTSSFKYRGTTWQRITVSFDTNENTSARVRLVAEAGDGEVKFDDIKIWEHIVKEDYSKKFGYVMYEDFENVSQGYGGFEYISGSLQTQLKERPSNDVVTPDAKKQGPLFTWVLSGNSSLKVGESASGRGIRTSENGMKLEPNAEYKVGFKYTMEKNVFYRLDIVSRSTGEKVLSETLDKFEAKGDGETYNTKEYTFTTGDANDYQAKFVIFGINSNAKIDTMAFILDDFYVIDASVDITNYNITAKDSVNGEFTLDKEVARKGELVSVTATPNEGYTLDKIFVNGIEVTSPFEMLAEDVEVEVTFKAAANKEVLKLAIKNAEEINRDLYTLSSLKAFDKAYKDALSIINDDTVSQEVIDAYANALIDATDKLVIKTEDKPVAEVDKALLSNAIKEKGNADASKYTADSYAVYLEGLVFARQVLNNKHASNADVINAIIWLNEGFDQLVVREVITPPTNNNNNSNNGGNTNVVKPEEKPEESIEPTEKPEESIEPTKEPEKKPEETFDIDEDTQETPVVEEDTKGGNSGMLIGMVAAVCALIAGGAYVISKKLKG
ncbi:MAG: endo-alpha-N-acetylgalactosaminidase family protein [Anaerorhabdus sp.]